MKKTGKIIGMLAISVVVFLVLVYVQYTIANGTETVEVICAKTDLCEGTLINEKNAGDYLTFARVDARMVPESALKDKQEVMNMQTTRLLRKNELLTTASLCGDKYRETNYENPVKVSFQLSNIAYGLAGRVRSGNLVAIHSVDKTTSKDKEVIKTAYVSRVFDTDGKEIASTDTETLASMIEVVIDKKNLNEFNECNAGGDMVVTMDKGMIVQGGEK